MRHFWGIRTNVRKKIKIKNITNYVKNRYNVIEKRQNRHIDIMVATLNVAGGIETR